MNNCELRKRRITDFFKSQENVEKKARRNLSLPSSSSMDLKCPKQKIFDEIEAVREKKSRKRFEINLDKNQRILDAGQSKIGNIVCDECDMIYCVDNMEDSKRHDLYHNKFKNTDFFRIEKTLLTLFRKCAHKKVGQHNIFHIGNRSPTILKNAIDEWMIHIDESIGYCSQSNLWDSGKRLFLCITQIPEDSCCLSGVLVVEKLNEAKTENLSKIIKADLADDWIIGVDRIWVHNTVRKSGIASALLDSATVLDKHMEYRRRRLRVAFSELTEDGKQFAKQYISSRYRSEDQSNEELLIY